MIEVRQGHAPDLPRLLDLFCGSGGAAMGYSRAGFQVFGVDNDPAPLRHYPFPHVCADALLYCAEHGHEYDAIHASPPCQAYSIMHNLPWLRGREYPLLILPALELLEAIGRPYVIENVMGARHGAKGLKRRNLEAHGLKAGWLCGTMFGLPFYRHRLFATNFLWLAPGHPKHTLNQHPRSERWVYGGAVKGLPGGAAGLDVKPRYNPVNVACPSRRIYTRKAGKYAGKVETVNKGGVTENLGHPGNGAQAAGAGVGHAKGWHLAATAMGIDWMDRASLTQAIPPIYTEHIGKQLLWLLQTADDF